MSDAGPTLLRDPQFLRYLLARSLSTIGNIATLVALPVLVYRSSGSAGLTALVAACEAAPYLLFGLFSGALTDRWNRKRVMVSADACSTALLLTIPLTHLVVGEVPVPQVLLVAFLGPTIGVFFDGAVFGAVPLLVGRGRIAVANSYLWSLQSVIEIAVPSAVGLLLGFLHPAWVLGLDAVTFAVSAALLVGITRPLHDATRERPPLTVGQLGRDIRDGLRYLLGHAGVRTMTIVGTIQCLSGGGFIALQVVWMDRILDVGTSGWRFGAVFSAWAIGGLLASLALPRLVRRVQPAQIALWSLPVAAGTALLVPWLQPWWLAALALACWALPYTLVVINSITYRQQVTPEHLLGRVNTAGRMLSWGLGWTGGALLAGLLVGPLGLRGTLMACTALGVVSVAVAWTSPLRHLATPTHPSTPESEGIAAG